jgi:hypothetical protein
MKSPTRNVIKAQLAEIAQLACRPPLLRLHPKLRWLDAACPFVEDISSADTISKRKRRKLRRRRRPENLHSASPFRHELQHDPNSPKDSLT